MKNTIVIAVGVLIVVALIAAGSIWYKSSSQNADIPSEQSNTGSAASANTEVREGLIETEIKNFTFVPSEIKIKVGSKITWYNRDQSSYHTVNSDSGGKAELNSGALAPGESYGHVFNTPGTFNYHCNFHNEKGKVVVVE